MAVVNARISSFDYDAAEDTVDLRTQLIDLRTSMERKLEMYHEGTTVHTQYLMFLEELDGIVAEMD